MRKSNFEGKFFWSTFGDSSYILVFISWKQSQRFLWKLWRGHVLYLNNTSTLVGGLEKFIFQLFFTGFVSTCSKVFIFKIVLFPLWERPILRVNFLGPLLVISVIFWCSYLENCCNVFYENWGGSCVVSKQHPHTSGGSGNLHFSTFF